MAIFFFLVAYIKPPKAFRIRPKKNRKKTIIAREINSPLRRLPYSIGPLKRKKKGGKENTPKLPESQYNLARTTLLPLSFPCPKTQLHHLPALPPVRTAQSTRHGITALQRASTRRSSSSSCGDYTGLQQLIPRHGPTSTCFMMVHVYFGDRGETVLLHVLMHIHTYIHTSAYTCVGRFWNIWVLHVSI